MKLSTIIYILTKIEWETIKYNEVADDEAELKNNYLTYNIFNKWLTITKKQR